MGADQQNEVEMPMVEQLITQAESFDDENAGDLKEERRGDSTEIQVVGRTDVQTETTTAVALPTTFTKIEKSLASLGFFTPSSKRLKDKKVKLISFTREVGGKRVEVSAKIVPSALFGLPITADQDKYLALQEIITTKLSEGAVINPIRFKSAELLRMMNRSRKAGKNYKEISEWLDVMMTTTIISEGTVYKAGEKRFAKDRFRVFDRAISVGKEMEDGTIADANYVWLSDWQLENINNNFLLPIDLATYRELKNHIAKALVPLLQIWLFATQKVGSFEKRYDELCEILTLQHYKATSLIVRQLQPSLDELIHYGYLAKWSIEKTSDRKAYKVIFFHGPKFHRDRRRRLQQKNRLEQSVVVAQSEPVEPNLPEPGKLESVTAPQQPIETSTTLASVPIDSVNVSEPDLVDALATRGLMPSVAIKLLESVPADRYDQVRDYIEYWEGSKGVGPGFLYDLIRNGDPLPPTFVSTRQKEARRREEEAKEHRRLIKDLLQSRYETYRKARIESFIQEELTVAEFERRVATHKDKSFTQTELWNGRGMSPQLVDQLAQAAVRDQLAQAACTLSFEDYRKRELPNILAELQVEPKDVGIELVPQAPTTDSASHPRALNAH